MPEALQVVAAVALRRGRERRLLQGHRWVYSNEVVHPDERPAPGALVRLVDHRGRRLATATYHPGALIAARVWTRAARDTLDESWFAARLDAARARRTMLVPGWEAYRVVNAEADGLPGLVVDRYGSLAVVQSHHAGTDPALPLVLPWLVQTLGCDAVLARNDARGRALETLPQDIEVLHGDVPERWTVREGQAPVTFAPAAGQKTGLYLDMRDTRDRILPWVAGRSVLDLYAYVGIAGVRAALAGATAVCCVDSSQAACALAADNARAAGVEGRVTVEQADVRALLKEVPPGSVDVVLCDPPALIPSKRAAREGLNAYRRLNYLALRAVRPGGLLVTSSCSFHLDEVALEAVVASAARRQDRRVLRVWRGGAAPDHPVLPEHAQSAYLKSLAFQVEGEPRGAAD